MYDKTTRRRNDENDATTQRKGHSQPGLSTGLNYAKRRLTLGEARRDGTGLPKATQPLRVTAPHSPHSFHSSITPTWLMTRSSDPWVLTSALSSRSVAGGRIQWYVHTNIFATMSLFALFASNRPTDNLSLGPQASTPPPLDVSSRKSRQDTVCKRPGCVRREGRGGRQGRQDRWKGWSIGLWTWDQCFLQ